MSSIEKMGDKLGLGIHIQQCSQDPSAWSPENFAATFDEMAKKGSAALNKKQAEKEEKEKQAAQQTKKDKGAGKSSTKNDDRSKTKGGKSVADRIVDTVTTGNWSDKDEEAFMRVFNDEGFIDAMAADMSGFTGEFPLTQEEFQREFARMDAKVMEEIKQTHGVEDEQIAYKIKMKLGEKMSQSMEDLKKRVEGRMNEKFQKELEEEEKEEELNKKRKEIEDKLRKEIRDANKGKEEVKKEGGNKDDKKKKSENKETVKKEENKQTKKKEEDKKNKDDDIEVIKRNDDDDDDDEKGELTVVSLFCHLIHVVYFPFVFSSI